ncbi:putative G2/M phase-specific E3 ubiquitin-protein ligase-like [Apostichopus japonicus]|uniref:Putative G2/M phase-specific E3 ubiquitin-protein ligase-like n=1 Tax=Stichopus japonicus TaxID=307972 RepID=A0A2G8L2I1_STIJA|nr:putative G2/M phase-specific E3 ubiquitin-protein ligase-like [Apostichopus japonicus]
MFILFLKKYRIPDIRKKVLKAAGLGHKKLILDAAMAAGDLQETLFSEFPKLRDAGGFQFARTPGHQKEIEVIPLPPGGGYSVANLKAVANQTFIFLRPIQRELDISELDDAGEQPIVDDTMQECFGCGVDIPETRLIKHRQSCSGIRNEVIDQPGLAAIPPEQLSTSIQDQHLPHIRDSFYTRTIYHTILSARNNPSHVLFI